MKMPSTTLYGSYSLGLKIFGQTPILGQANINPDEILFNLLSTISTSSGPTTRRRQPCWRVEDPPLNYLFGSNSIGDHRPEIDHIYSVATLIGLWSLTTSFSLQTEKPQQGP